MIRIIIISQFSIFRGHWAAIVITVTTMIHFVNVNGVYTIPLYLLCFRIILKTPSTLKFHVPVLHYPAPEVFNPVCYCWLCISMVCLRKAFAQPIEVHQTNIFINWWHFTLHKRDMKQITLSVSLPIATQVSKTSGLSNNYFTIPSSPTKKLPLILICMHFGINWINSSLSYQGFYSIKIQPLTSKSLYVDETISAISSIDFLSELVPNKSCQCLDEIHQTPKEKMHFIIDFHSAIIFLFLNSLLFH